jgi:hypothetical protein
MSKIFKTALISLVSVSVLSCTPKKTDGSKDQGQLQNLNLPSWVLDPRVEGKIAAVGIAPASKGGLKVQIAQAEADAMGNMAGQISTEVSRITKDALQKANVDNNEAYQAAFSQATKNVVNRVPLSGAVRVNVYRDATSGELYVHMVLDSSIIKNFLEQQLDTFKDSLANAGATRKVIEATQNSMKPMFDELDLETKESGSAKPSN